MTAAATVMSLAGSARGLGSSPVHVGRVRMFGTRAWIAYTRDDSEWARRADGLALTDLELLDALMSLPLGTAVPAHTISATDRRVLRRAPSAASWLDRMVLRHAVRPVTPVLAMVRAADWMTGLVGASQFASYCPRMVITASLPADGDIALAQADLYGIGVALAADEGAPRIVVEPEPLIDWQPTPAGWWFAEEIFRQQHPQS